MLSLWRRLPVIVRAVLTGSLVTTVGTVPWALVASANQKFWPSVPWAAPLTALYLWLLWRYLRGEGWPRSTAEARRTSLRANRLSDDAWGTAVFAGVIGLVGVVLLLNVTQRLVRVSPEQVPDLSQIPPLTLLSLLVMGPVVAGVVEESAFRGYMQGPIERRHGPVVAILVTGIMFGFAHFSHPEVTLAFMPYYFAVAAVYGMLAYRTNSILPSMVLHAGGNLLSSIGLLAGGKATPPPLVRPGPLIWETGPDASFWVSLVALIAVGAAAVGAYAALPNTARERP